MARRDWLLLHPDSPLPEDLQEPSVPPAVRDVWDIWGLVSTQWRTSMSGLVGLDLTAVGVVVESMGLKLDEEMLYWLRHLEMWTLDKQWQQTQQHH